MLIALIGFAAGILSGMGVGGGMLLIPALTLFAGTEQHIAQTVNLFYFVPTAVTALAVHIKNKNVALRPAIKLAAVGFIFSVLGAAAAVSLSSEMLKRIFGVFIIFFGVREIAAGFKKNKST